MKQASALQSITDEKLTAALGWFSLGLGSAQLMVPGAVNWLAGIDRRPATSSCSAPSAYASSALPGPLQRPPSVSMGVGPGGG